MHYVIGLGNYLMGDDSIGVRIVEYLAEQRLDHGFEAIEIGSNGLNLLTYFQETTKRILIVDAADFGGNPGDWTCFAPEEVESNKVVGEISTHEGDVLKLIALARQLEQTVPPIRIVAIQPKVVTMTDVISPELARNFGGYVDTVLREIGAAPPASRETPAFPDLTVSEASNGLS